MKIEVNNVVGYPTLDPRVRQFAKDNDCLLLVGLHLLNKLSPADRLSQKVKIVVDPLSALDKVGLPLLGYGRAGLRYVKSEMSLVHTGMRKFKVPEQKRLPPKVFASLLATPHKLKFIEALDPKASYYGVARAMISPLHAASIDDPTPATKKRKKKQRN